MIKKQKLQLTDLNVNLKLVIIKLKCCSNFYHDFFYFTDHFIKEKTIKLLNSFMNVLLYFLRIKI